MTSPAPGVMQDRSALVETSRKSIARGSKSFAAASRLFDKTTRERVWLLYAWCRRCDDLADDQDHGGPLGLGETGDETGRTDERLDIIRTLTQRAFDGVPTGDPAFDAFGLVARECGITPDMADDVIAGFALDAADWRPRSESDLMRYCYHVAGAVGVMMGVVMGVDPQDDETLDRACDLGLAFQLANIARDVAEDDTAGRCYLPVEWLVDADIPPGQHMKPPFRTALTGMAARLVTLSQAHENAARAGAAKLGIRQRWAVLSAAGIYGAIAARVGRAGPQAWDNRIHTGGWAKLGYVARGLWQALSPPPPPAALPRWTRQELIARARA